MAALSSDRIHPHQHADSDVVGFYIQGAELGGCFSSLNLSDITDITKSMRKKEHPATMKRVHFMHKSLNTQHYAAAWLCVACV